MDPLDIVMAVPHDLSIGWAHSYHYHRPIASVSLRRPQLVNLIGGFLINTTGMSGVGLKNTTKIGYLERGPWLGCVLDVG